MTTGENLRSIEETFRDAHAGHIRVQRAPAGPRLWLCLGCLLWISICRPLRARAGRRAMPLRASEALEAINPKVTQPLVPIWMTSPLSGSVSSSRRLPRRTPPPPRRRVPLCCAHRAECGDPARAGDRVRRPGCRVTHALPRLGRSRSRARRRSSTARPPSTTSWRPRCCMMRRRRRRHRGVDQELTGLVSSALYENQLTRLPDAAQLTGQDRRFTVELVAGGRGPNG